MMAANQKVLMAYAAEPYMHDPGLRVRLADVDVPATELWILSIVAAMPKAFPAVVSKSSPKLDIFLT
jgi:hypothetical protein